MLQPGTAADGRQPGTKTGITDPADLDEPTVELYADPTAELGGPADGDSGAARAALARPEVTPNGDIGRVLDERYVIEERLGQGGSALIMRARDLQRRGARNNGHIAIKTLRPELRFRPQSIARLQREFRQTQLLAHPNVVRQFDIGCDNGNWFIAMELLDGEPLRKRLKAAPDGLPVPEALRIAAACGDALAHAHDKGVTHGDVKPDNVFVTESRDVRMLDFGVAPDAPAARIDSTPPKPFVPAATKAYASPEVLAGLAPQPRDDVFSLACVIYEMLTGRHPYGRLGADEAMKQEVAVERVPGLTAKQWGALAAGLAWKREARPAHVRDLLRSLSVDAVSPTPVVKHRQPSRISVATPRWAERMRGQAVGMVALIGMVIVLAIVEAGDDPEPAAMAVSDSPADTGIAAASDLAGPVETGESDADAAPTPPAAEVRQAAAPAPPARHVSFKTEKMVVSRGTVSAAIPIQLDPGARRVKVEWRTDDGSAVAGRDYGGPGSGIATFQERQTDRILYVPIVNDYSVTADRSFTVELTGAPAGAELGSPRRIEVTIQGAG
ncbi:MAG TPA: protein kinase [Steroidobacteraceae bacterium]|nr:protein kinase [Steroidobacteraceae bacterium]